MFIIFGWGNDEPVDYGPALPVNCPNCHNKTYWHLVRRKRLFRLFFIPVFPLEDRWGLLCSVCSHGTEIGPEQVPLAENLTRLTAGFMDQRVSLAEYVKELEASSVNVPWSMPDDPPVKALAGVLPEPQVLPVVNAGPWVCKHCGEESPESFGSCWNCGFSPTGDPPPADSTIDEAVPDLKRMKQNQSNPFGTLPL